VCTCVYDVCKEGIRLMSHFRLPLCISNKRVSYKLKNASEVNHLMVYLLGYSLLTRPLNSSCLLVCAEKLT